MADAPPPRPPRRRKVNPPESSEASAAKRRSRRRSRRSRTSSILVADPPAPQETDPAQSVPNDASAPKRRPAPQMPPKTIPMSSRESLSTKPLPAAPPSRNRRRRSQRKSRQSIDLEKQSVKSGGPPSKSVPSTPSLDDPFGLEKKPVPPSKPVPPAPSLDDPFGLEKKPVPPSKPVPSTPSLDDPFGLEKKPVPPSKPVPSTPSLDDPFGLEKKPVPPSKPVPSTPSLDDPFGLEKNPPARPKRRLPRAPPAPGGAPEVAKPHTPPHHAGDHYNPFLVDKAKEEEKKRLEKKADDEKKAKLIETEQLKKKADLKKQAEAKEAERKRLEKKADDVRIKIEKTTIAEPASTRIAPANATPKTKMLTWVQNQIDGYNIPMNNFHTHWQNGMAFCALAHSRWPDAFDFASLDPANSIGNLGLAFRIGAERASIDSFLDPDDIAGPGMTRPDEKSMMVVVAQWQKALAGLPRRCGGFKKQPAPKTSKPVEAMRAYRGQQAGGGANSDLLAASACGDVDGVRKAIAGGAQLNDAIDPGEYNASSLHLAAKGGHDAVINLLCGRGASCRKGDKYGYVPIHIAARAGQTSAVRTLLQQGTPINITSTFGYTAVILAAQRGRADVLRLLLDRGANHKLGLTTSGKTAADVICEAQDADKTREAEIRSWLS